MDATLTGHLLVASPAMSDPNFARAVVLIGVHTDDGAMGVIINQPSETAVATAVPELEPAVDTEDPVYVGGPVRPESVVLLAEFIDPSPKALLVLGRIGFPVNTSDIEGLAETTSRRRVYAGYAGWTAGQLDREIAQGDWVTDPATPEDVFSEAPEDLWTSVLVRKGGGYALLARMPSDPSVN